MLNNNERFAEITDKMIFRLGFGEKLQHVIESPKTCEILSAEFERCSNQMKKSILYVPDEYKECATENFEKFLSQKEKFFSDFYFNFKIVLGMEPFVYFSENVSDDAALKKIIIEFFESPKVEDIVRQTLESQFNSIMRNFFIATATKNDLKNMSFELMLIINSIDKSSNAITLPSTIKFM